MFEDETTVDAEQENVADSPIETEELTEEAEATEEAEPGEESAAEEAEQAAPAKQQPEKKQSKAEDSKYAAARKEAEAQARAAKAEAEAAKQRADAFAMQYGYASFEAMERAEAAKRYADQGMTPEAAQKAAELDEREARLKAQEQAIQAERAEREKWNSLFTKHPEIKSMADVPDEVRAAVEEGETPIHAYNAWRADKLASELSALKQNSANKDKALGNVKGTAPIKTKSDPFLDGLN